MLQQQLAHLVALNPAQIGFSHSLYLFLDNSSEDRSQVAEVLLRLRDRYARIEDHQCRLVFHLRVVRESQPGLGSKIQSVSNVLDLGNAKRGISYPLLEQRMSDRRLVKTRQVTESIVEPEE